MPQYIVGVDLGATKTLIGLADTDGRILDRMKFPTCIDKGAGYILDQICDGINEITRANGCSSAEIRSIALAAPGPLAYPEGVVWDSPNLGWSRVALQDEISRRLDRSAIVEKDTNMAALGEYHFGQNRRKSNLLYVTVSTGIGGGIIVDGQLFRGKNGGAGEIGHMVVAPEGRRCRCGRTGCLEALASGTAIAEMAKELIAQGKAQGILSYCPTGKEIKAQHVAEAARRGDDEAGQIIKQVALHLGTALANLVNIFDPQIIVLGGGVAVGMADLLLESVFNHVKEQVFALNARGLELELTCLGEDIVLYGCITAALREIDLRK